MPLVAAELRFAQRLDALLVQVPLAAVISFQLLKLRFVAGELRSLGVQAVFGRGDRFLSRLPGERLSCLEGRHVGQVDRGHLLGRRQLLSQVLRRAFQLIFQVGRRRLNRQQTFAALDVAALVQMRRDAGDDPIDRSGQLLRAKARLKGDHPSRTASRLLPGQKHQAENGHDHG